MEALTASSIVGRNKWVLTRKIRALSGYSVATNSASAEPVFWVSHVQPQFVSIYPQALERLVARSDDRPKGQDLTENTVEAPTRSARARKRRGPPSTSKPLKEG